MILSLQLCLMYFIFFNIDIRLIYYLGTVCFYFLGTIWAFSLQVLVGKSTWSSDQEYKTLLSGVQLMTPKDCRQEQNKQKLRMFKYGKSCSTLTFGINLRQKNK